MQEINGQGLSIATDRVVLSMHQDLTAMHVQLLKQIDEAQQKKGNHTPYSLNWVMNILISATSSGIKFNFLFRDFHVK